MQAESRVERRPSGGPRQAQIREELDRALRSNAFCHSRRSQDFLRYIVEQTLAGQIDRLKERSIAVELFGREPSYDTTQDAIVRVAANDVRKRLADYYRSAPACTVSIVLSAGSYVPEFSFAVHPVAPPSVEPPSPSRSHLTLREGVMAGALLALFGLTIFLGIQVARQSGRAPAPPHESQDLAWPLSQVFQNDRRTIVVTADANAGMLGVLRGKPIQLEEYLQPGFFTQQPEIKAGGSGIGKIVYGAQLTSFADATLIATLYKAAGRYSDSIDLRFARNVRMRDFQENNFILLGSPSSNPWVSLFDGHLNFRESVAFPGPREFVNKKPAAGEQSRYQGFPWTGSSGEEYATISLLPTESHRGSVLILQGLHQEGTESAGDMVSTASGRQKLKNALGAAARGSNSFWFEALIRTRAVAGTTRATEVVATRVWRDPTSH